MGAEVCPPLVIVAPSSTAKCITQEVFLGRTLCCELLCHVPPKCWQSRIATPNHLGSFIQLLDAEAGILGPFLLQLLGSYLFKVAILAQAETEATTSKFMLLVDDPGKP